MTPIKIKTSETPKHCYKDYQKKATEFFNVMTMCLQDSEWDAAVLNGVHSAISITDAVVVFREQLRSISQKHDDAVVLLRQYIPSDILENQDTRLARILNFKNLVSYQPIRLDESKAREFAKSVERYFEWARKMLP